MGCCKSRDTREIPEIKAVSSAEEDRSLATASTNSRFSDFISNWETFESEDIDGRSQTIEESVSELVKSKQWVSYIETADYSIRTLEKSQFSVNSPVVLGFISMDSTVKSSFITQALLEPKIRLSWDSTIETFDLIGSYSYDGMTFKISKRFPFINREFIVRTAVYTKNNATSVIMYSEKNEGFAGKRNLRAEILFCVIKIVELPAQTLFTCVQQIENKAGRQFSALTASDLSQWMTIFKKFLLGLPESKS